MRPQPQVEGGEIPGCSHSTQDAIQAKRSRSAAICRSIPGRSTLTATSSPSVVVAKCTWAIEAAATGSVVKVLEEIFKGSSEFRLDQRTRGLPIEGRQAVLQFSEIGGKALAKEIGASRKALAELDEAWPERLQTRAPDAGLDAPAPLVREPPTKTENDTGQGQTLNEEQRVMLRQASDDATRR